MGVTKLEVVRSDLNAIHDGGGGGGNMIEERLRHLESDVAVIKSTMVTKDDFYDMNQSLRDDFHKSNESLRDDFHKSNQSLRDDFHKSNESLRDDFYKSNESLRDDFHKSHVSLIKWMISAAFVIISAIGGIMVAIANMLVKTFNG